MGRSNTKGKQGELEVRQILFDHLGLNFARDLSQWREADRGDLICTDCDFPFVIEVKRWGHYEARPRGSWWDQVCTASKAADKLPLLVYRFDRQQWRWRMPVAAVIKAGLPHGMHGADDDAKFDWGYACEFDNTETAMMIIRELLSDGTT
tara:strand:- start:278 stop:727 length:450 start_codon:yes stop_codon:yes gene_type:complete